ncbi:MAG TPA: potassium-transporting ATPase subunit F [Thermoplasmata archaeon]|nr:potassium-transporting ATPase subunit F [Thermoplasmata archaeon]
MDVAAWIAHDLGLVVLTLVVVGLAGYLVYTMVHPERL